MDSPPVGAGEGEAGEKLLGLYKSTGKPVWTYTCSINMKSLDPLDYYRLKPWRAWKLGLNGVCYWAYNSWRGDPWNDFDGEIGDCGAVYNGPLGPVTSRRWEAWREGLEDYLYLHLLKSAAAATDAQTPRTMTPRVIVRFITLSLNPYLIFPNAG